MVVYLVIPLQITPVNRIPI